MARDRASRPETRPLRLFVAIEVPEEARRAVEGAVEPWRSRFPRARWAPKENWHVTLKFLGSTWPRLVEWVHEQIASVAADHAPFETQIAELGSFPSARRARVLWAGLDDSAGRAAELALALDHAFAREFKPENRAFRPHLTVARSEPPLAVPVEFAATVVAGRPFAVEALTLFRSHLQRPAPRYEELAVFPLG